MRKHVAVAAAGAACAVGLTASCGDRITANRTWNAHVASSTSYVTTSVRILRGSMPIVDRHDLLTGPLLGTKNRVIAGSTFREDCITHLKADRQPMPGTAYQLPGYKDCSIVVKVGGKVYAAGSRRAGPFDVFQGSNYAGTISVLKVNATTVSVRLNPKSYLECSTTLRSHNNEDGTITYTTVYPDGHLMKELRPDHTWDPATAPTSLITKLGLPPRPNTPEARANWVRDFAGLDQESPNFCIALGVHA